jgi:hypothetical protein
MRHGLVAACLLLLAGCMTTQPVNYRPHYGNYSQLQSEPQSRCTVAVTGQRAADPKLDDLHVRAAKMASPDKDGYAGFIASALNEEFGKAGIYALPPRRALSLTLEKNKLDTPAGRAYAEIAITVTVVDAQSQAEVAQIPMTVKHEWDSAFFADTAVNRAIGEYSEAVADLNGKLFADPRFRQAIDCSAAASAAR